MAFKEKADIPFIDYPSEFGYQKRKVLMSPTRFLELTQLTATSPEARSMPFDEYVNQIRHPMRIERITRGLLSPRRVVPAIYLEFKQGKIKEHEGRNRAIAAMELGRETVPVFIMWRMGEPFPLEEGMAPTSYWEQ